MFKLLFIFILFSFFLNYNYLLIFFLLLMFLMVFFIPSFFMFFFNNYMFMDILSFFLILLTLWIFFLMILSINKNNFYNMLIIFVIYLLFIFLYFSFIFNSYLFFYIFFEMSLIPTLYLIIGWGYQPERIKAGMYLFFYTLLASLPLLISLLFLFNLFKTFLIINNNYYLISMNFLYFSLLMAFLVKLPMFFFHLWLPKAHVEAPILGSMILAAVLLKLGGYGLLRMLNYLQKFIYFNLLIMIISILGGILISINCLRQLDLKLLIAYSSVSHMALILGGMMTLTNWGIFGSYLMMIGHGLCSSGLFCLANISYERTFSRSMIINKGMINFLPSISLWWFLLCSSNMSSPISLNLIGEISLINSLIMFSKINILLLMFLCFFSASYCYYLYSYSQHGIFFSGIFMFSNSFIREFLLLMFHWFSLNFLFMKIFLF